MSLIIPSNDLKVYVEQVQQILTLQLSSDNVDMLREHIMDVCNVAANIPLMQASAKYYLEQKKKEVIPEVAEKKFTPLITKEYINSLCAPELSIYELIKEQGSELDKRRQSIVTLISYEKKLIEASMQTR